MRFLVAAFGAAFVRFELDFLAAGRFLLGVFFLAFVAFFLVTFLAGTRFFLAGVFLLAFFFVGFFFVTFFLLTRCFAAGAFFLDAFFAGFFFDALRFDDGRAAFFATRFLAAGFLRAAFLRLGFFLAAAFFDGIDIASNGRVRKTRDYTEVCAERNTLRARLAGLAKSRLRLPVDARRSPSCRYRRGR